MNHRHGDDGIWLVNDFPRWVVRARCGFDATEHVKARVAPDARLAAALESRRAEMSAIERKLRGSLTPPL